MSDFLSLWDRCNSSAIELIQAGEGKDVDSFYKAHLHDINGFCSLFDLCEGFETELIKAGKDLSRLRKMRRLVTRDGKTFLQTFHITDGVIGAKEGNIHLPEIPFAIPEDIAIGDKVAYRGKTKKTVGTLRSIYQNPKGEIEVTIRSDSDGKDKMYILQRGSYLTKEESSDASPEKFSSDSLKFVKTLPGSATVELVEDEVTGKKYVRKHPRDLPGGKDQLKTEYAVNLLYRQLGILVPDSRLLPDGSLLSDYIEPGKKIDEDVSSGFFADVLFANYDVLGSNFSNIIASKADGRLYRVDNGGSLEFRAKGKSKPFTSDPLPDLKSMLDTTSEQKEVFGKFKDEPLLLAQQIKASMDKVTDFALTLTSLVKDGYLSKEVSDKLADRYQALIQWAQKEEGSAEKKAVEKKTVEKIATKYKIEDFKKALREDLPIDKDSFAEKLVQREKRFYEASSVKKKYKTKAFLESLKQFASSCSFFIRAPVDKLSFILDDGRWKSQFETKTSMGCLSPSSRRETELEKMAYPYSVEDSLRPIYGLAGLTPEDTEKGDWYGNVLFELKKERLIDRTTIQFSDSLDTGRDYPSPMQAISPASIFSRVDGNPNIDSDVPASGKVDPKYIMKAVYHYAELQYHGQLTLDDVKTVHLKLSKYSAENLNTTINALSDYFAKMGKTIPIKFY